MNNLIQCLDGVRVHLNRLHIELQAANRYAALAFTPFRFIRHGEVPTTHLLAYFLDPDETHGQGDLYQRLFFVALQAYDERFNRLPPGKWYVRAEERHTIGQIDLLLVHHSQQFVLCLENKPLDSTGDQPQQLARYLTHIQVYPDFVLLYLSRVARPPANHSLSQNEINRLSSAGQYANITYSDFLLPLLDHWREQTLPEAVRLFLRHFRYHLEDWLNLPTTKPLVIMHDQEIAALLAKSPEQVEAALQIARSLTEMKEILMQRLMEALHQPALNVYGAPHWSWNRFGKLVGGQPFLIRPQEKLGEDGTVTYPWGRYSVCVEWFQYKLVYGVRYDLKNMYKGDIGAAEKESLIVSKQLSAAMAEPGKSRDFWPWYQLVGPTAEEDVFIGIANAQLTERLLEKLKDTITIVQQLVAEGLIKPTIIHSEAL